MQIAFRVPPEIKTALETAAAADDRTLSSLLMRIIKEWLAAQRGGKRCTEAALLHPATGQGTAESPSLASVRQTDRIASMRETYREIVESDRGESELMSDYRWACDEIERLCQEVAAFCGPWAVTYAVEHGLPPGHLHPEHYDILARVGARMDDFKRAEMANV